MHLLDTDTITYLHAGHPRVIAHLRALDDPEVAIAIVTKIELLRGRFEFLMKAEEGTNLLRAQRLLLRTEELLDQMIVIPFDDASAARFDALREILGIRRIGRADLLIASIALTRRAVLVTRNLRHFRQVPGLRAVNWVDDQE